MNLTAFKLTGLVLIPYVLTNFKLLFRSIAFRILLGLCVYYLFLGLIYGHIFPWVDETGLKAGRDIPQWRSIIYLGSMALELSTTLYLAIQFSEIKNILLSIRSITLAAIISSIAAWLEYILHFDFYSFFTSQSAVFIPHRMKGLNYEPRGFAQLCSYSSVLSSLMYMYTKEKLFIFPFLIGLSSLFFLTFSATGIIILLVGITYSLFLFFAGDFKLPRIFYKFILVISLSIPLMIMFIPKNKLNFFSHHLSERSYLLKPGSFVSKLEVFDAAATNFLTKNPVHLFFGTGPGLISIPIGTKYIIDRDRGSWNKGIVALPHMGIVLLISNGGIVGFTLWLLMIIFCIRDYINLKNKHNEEYGTLIFSLFILFVFLYLLQIRLFYYIGLAIGLGWGLPRESSPDLQKCQ